MKKSLKIAACVLVLAAVLCPAVIYAADYLTENDPIVTLSYITDIFAPKLKNDIKNEIKSELSAGMPENSAEASDNKTDNSVPSGFEVIELSAWQKLTSKEGAVELIVRPGSKAVVVSDSQEIGLSDVTDAKEILSGEEVGINHLLIIPRNDGRGIAVISDKAYVLVRGKYTVSD